MRFAGPAMYTNPAEIPYVTTRMAGELPKENPELVQRITQAIIPGQDSFENDTQQAAAYN